MGTILSTLIAYPANLALVRPPVPAAGAITRGVRVQQEDLEDVEAGGHRAHRIAIEEQQILKIQRMLSKTIGILMVILFLLCILLGPDFNNANSDHRLFDLSPSAIYIAYRVVLGVWFVTFILYALLGAWSRLRGSQRRVHRLLFIVLIIAAIAAKLIVPNQIQLSYAPAALTILAEVTYLLIDLTCEILHRVFLHWIPSLFGKLGELMAAIWAVVTRWFRFHFNIRIGTE